MDQATFDWWVSHRWQEREYIPTEEDLEDMARHYAQQVQNESEASGV